MSGYHRLTSPKVINGTVQKKNRHELTPTYWNTPQKMPVIDKERPGRGYRHLLNRKHILQFIEIIPEWDKLSEGLDAILLARGNYRVDGWYGRGVIGVCAWERDLWREAPDAYFQAHEECFSRLGVESERQGKYHVCQFTEKTARAYLLLHIFLHELGHHHDRMTTKRQTRTGRGESYAEHWAFKHEKTVWDAYLKRFDLV